MFLKEVSSDCQACIYLITNAQKILCQSKTTVLHTHTHTHTEIYTHTHTHTHTHRYTHTHTHTHTHTPRRYVSVNFRDMIFMIYTALIHLILSSVRLHHLPPLLSQLMTLQLFLQRKLKHSVVSFHLHSHRTSNQLDPLLKLPSSPSVPSLRRKYPNFSSPAILQHVL